MIPQWGWGVNINHTQINPVPPPNPAEEAEEAEEEGRSDLKFKPILQPHASNRGRRSEKMGWLIFCCLTPHPEIQTPQTLFAPDFPFFTRWIGGDGLNRNGMDTRLSRFGPVGWGWAMRRSCRQICRWSDDRYDVDAHARTPLWLDHQIIKRSNPPTNQLLKN